jgi:hypothetical protein
MGSKRPTASKRKTIKALQEELVALQGVRELEAKKLRGEIRGLIQEVDIEKRTRIAAQQGLVPYVRSLEQLNVWLQARPHLAAELQPIMAELGLWGIRVGYDPDRDINLTAASPHRR